MFLLFFFFNLNGEATHEEKGFKHLSSFFKNKLEHVQSDMFQLYGGKALRRSDTPEQSTETWTSSWSESL